MGYPKALGHPPFKHRRAAGRQLAEALSGYANQPDTVILALPRGGVPVAYEIAVELNLPLDICLVRKLGVPDQPELAMGAIAGGGVRILNQSCIERLGVSQQAIDRVTTAETAELERREATYRQATPQLPIAGKTVILVDDGIATGATLQAAIALLKQHHPTRLIVAAPVAAPSTIAELQTKVDDVVCLMTPEPLNSISQWYQNFDQTSDAVVCRLLEQAHQQFSPTDDAGSP